MSIESPSNSSIADTLRTMAKSYAWKEGDDYSQEITACEAGAAAWEIVLKTFSGDPWQNDRYQPLEGPKIQWCQWCRFRRLEGEEGHHKVDCLWLQAQTLVQPR